MAALVALAQMDILEIHTWNSVAEQLEKPNRVVFDRDPATDVPWTGVVEAAREVRERLWQYGLESWVKTMEGKGRHVVVPLWPGATGTTSSVAPGVRPPVRPTCRSRPEWRFAPSERAR